MKQTEEQARARIKHQKRELRRLNRILRDHAEYLASSRGYRHDKKLSIRIQLMEAWFINHVKADGFSEERAWQLIRELFHEVAT